MTLESPLVSVVLPTNRNSPWIRESLESVQNQSYQRWELVVVDNGVPDGDALAAVVRNVPGARLVTARPYSLGFARNVGACHSAGELLVFHDDDDVWKSERLASQVAALAATHDAPASYVGGWHLDADGDDLGSPFPAVPASASEMLSAKARLPQICGTLMVRRQAHFEVGGFAPELAIMEDFEYMLRLLALGSFACVPDELLGYRRHGGNMTDTSGIGRARRRKVMEDSLLRLADAAKDRGDAAQAELLAEHLRYFRTDGARAAGLDSLTALRGRRWREAASELGWGLRRAPGVTLRTASGRLVRGRR